MFCKNFVTFCFLVLSITNLVGAAADSDSLASEFEKTLAGVKYFCFEESYYIFDDAIYMAESVKYTSLNKLKSFELMEYAGPIDYASTHLLAEKGIAIVTPEGEINQAATGFIHDCVGVVMRQISADDSVFRTLVAHGCEHNTYTSPGQQPHDDFKDLISIIDGFLVGVLPHNIKVDFVTTYNTDHLFDLCTYARSKGVLESNITLTGNFPADKRPIRKCIGRDEITYFPAEYSIVALKSSPIDADSDPMTEYFWHNYLSCMNFFVDATGKLYPKIKDYLKDAGLKDRVPTLLNHHPQIRLGLSLGISRKAYCPVPDTKQKCQEELDTLASRDVSNPMGGIS